MKRNIIILGILLIVGHALTEFYQVLRFLIPDYETKNLDLFVSPSFKMELNVLYYAKFMADDLLFCITFFVFCKVAKEYSVKLFLIGWVYFTYHMLDSFFFWWDYKTSNILYVVMLLTLVIATIILMLPIKEKKSVYKSMV